METEQQADSSESLSNIPRHIAIIMDGNGRWAKQRKLPRTAGHQAGVKSVRNVVDYCGRLGVDVLTLFAFSSENWRRPEQEVSMLMDLFITTLQREVDKLDKNGVRMVFVGDTSAFSQKLQDKIAFSESVTANNTGLTLVIAVNYGGRWDIAQATRTIAEKVASGKLAASEIDEQLILAHLSTAQLPEPDLFIRTGGEQRISNFLLWQMAYTEFYFSPVLWPDFDQHSLQAAIEDYQGRQRRFGLTSEQIISSAVNS
jgi:undecaprenyl diphosphate synthase